MNISERKLNSLDAGCCIRPTTPTGLPDVGIHSINGKKHIMISGAGKAGSTQAPLLALYVVKKVGLGSNLESKLKAYKNQIGLESIRSGLDLLDQGLEPKT